MVNLQKELVMKLTSLALILICISCKPEKQNCSENFIITPENYKVFEKNISKYNSCSSIYFLRLSSINLNNLLNKMEVNNNFINLNNFSIRHCNLTKIPKIITKMDSLKTLDLSYNDIEVVSTNFNSLKKLKYLNLSNNKIVNIKTDFLELRQLELNKNKLSNFPFTNYNIKVKLLNLSDNKIKKINYDLIDINYLNYVFLSGNDFNKSDEIKIKNKLRNKAVFKELRNH